MTPRAFHLKLQQELVTRFDVKACKFTPSRYTVLLAVTFNLPEPDPYQRHVLYVNVSTTATDEQCSFKVLESIVNQVDAWLESMPEPKYFSIGL